MTGHVRHGSSALALLLIVPLGCAGDATRTAPSGPPHVSVPPKQETTSDMFARALRGVLLVANHRTDNQTGFGAAVLLPGNFAITNRHVVENSRSLSVMFYDPTRPSHGGLADEGGLRRYLFENERALVPAERLRDDPKLDLAILRIDADTSSYPRLPWRATPARIGERVFAVGHPGQNVWSFTTGLVSNTHVNALQIDASINEGNSGGPLIDEQGQVLGINTLRALGNVQGIGYARPVALARAIVDGVPDGGGVDLSSPEKAQATCARAAEMGSEAWVDCEDLESTQEFFALALKRALAEIGDPLPMVETVEFERTHPAIDVKIDLTRRSRAAFIRGDKAAMAAASKEMGEIMKAARRAPPHGENPFSKLAQSDLRKIKERILQAERQSREEESALQQAMVKRTNFQSAAPFNLTSVMSDTLRTGQRIERVSKVDASRAWVAIAGLNKDGSHYQFSQLWVQRAGKWREMRIPFPPHTATLPADFPPTPYDGEQVAAHHRDLALTSWGPRVTDALREADSSSAKPIKKRGGPRDSGSSKSGPRRPTN